MNDKIKTNLFLPENVKLDFQDNGEIHVYVTLPIPKNVVKHVGNLKNYFITKDRAYYTLYSKAKSASKVNIENAWKTALNKAMVNIRNYKILELENETRTLNAQLSLDL